MHYLKNGLLHREGGPAVVTKDKKEWWQNGKRHNLDGPAVEYEGVKNKYEWWQYGELHREDGPAIEYFWVCSKYIRGVKIQTDADMVTVCQWIKDNGMDINNLSEEDKSFLRMIWGVS